MIAYAYKIK